MPEPLTTQVCIGGYIDADQLRRAGFDYSRRECHGRGLCVDYEGAEDNGKRWKSEDSAGVEQGKA